MSFFEIRKVVSSILVLQKVYNHTIQQDLWQKENLCSGLLNLCRFLIKLLHLKWRRMQTPFSILVEVTV